MWFLESLWLHNVDWSKSLREHLRIQEIFIEDKNKSYSFAYLPEVLHKIICCGYLLESPRRGDSNISPQHMILWRNNHFLSF